MEVRLDMLGDVSRDAGFWRFLVPAGRVCRRGGWKWGIVGEGAEMCGSVMVWYDKIATGGDVGVLGCWGVGVLGWVAQHGGLP